MKPRITLPRPSSRTVSAVMTPIVLAVGTPLAVGGLFISLAFHIHGAKSAASRG